MTIVTSRDDIFQETWIAGMIPLTSVVLIKCIVCQLFKFSFKQQK